MPMAVKTTANPAIPTTIPTAKAPERDMDPLGVTETAAEGVAMEGSVVVSGGAIGGSAQVNTAFVRHPLLYQS